MRREKTRKTKKRASTPRSRRAVTPLAHKPREGGPTRLAIATQPTLLRDVLSRCLSKEDGLEVVGGGHEDQIVQVLEKVTPEVLLFDYEALGPNSESIIGRLRRLSPRTRILVIATRSTDEHVDRVLRAGAAGLVGKQLGFDILTHAIRSVAAGELWANRRAQALTVEHLTNFAAGASEPEGQLTKREQQIVDGVARGLRNKEIARQLSITEKTVKSHLNNIFHKLGLEGRFALAIFDQGQIQPRS